MKKLFKIFFILTALIISVQISFCKSAFNVTGKKSQNAKAVTTNNQEASLEAYMKELPNKLKNNWDLPQTDKETKVVVLFEIGYDGRLISHKIKKSSGYLPADRAAMHAVELSAPFPPLPKGFNGKSVFVEFVFESKIKETDKEFKNKENTYSFSNNNSIQTNNNTYYEVEIEGLNMPVSNNTYSNRPQTPTNISKIKSKKQACLDELALLKVVLTYDDFSSQKSKQACDKVCGNVRPCYILFQRMQKGFTISDIGSDIEKCYYRTMGYDQATAYNQHLEQVKWREKSLQNSGYYEQQKQICESMKE